jgi:phosphate transport system protein
MDRRIDKELTDLTRALIKMSAVAEGMIEQAVKVVVERCPEAAQSVYRHEEQVNQFQLDIDEQCLDIIALYQPTAKDLRFILGVSKTNADLERLADQAVNICQKGEQLSPSHPAPMTDEIHRMARATCNQLKEALHAFVNGHVTQARRVLTLDDEVDEMKRAITRDLTARLEQAPGEARAGILMMLVAHNLERIGDHATNIAENTIFVVEGRDVRHHAG